MAYYLTGSFNAWKPDDPVYRFEEYSSPYAGDCPQDTLKTGSYSLLTHFDAGPISFKIVENGSWEHQWSVCETSEEKPQPIDSSCFETHHGIQVYPIAPRGTLEPPHACFNYPGDEMRWDFHPASRTIAIHADTRLSPSPVLREWETFNADTNTHFQTWVALPYGFHGHGQFRYPVCFFMGGRSLLYGEEKTHHIFNSPGRQWFRIVDILTRHGLVAPVVIIGLGWPAMQTEDGRSFTIERFDPSIFRDYMHVVFNDVIPNAEREFHLTGNPSDRYLVGHGSGADLAVSFLFERPDWFRGVFVVSPLSPEIFTPPAHLAGIPNSMRIAVAYAEREICSDAMTRTAALREVFSAEGLSHLIYYCPSTSHDPSDFFAHLPAGFAFIMS